MLGLDKFNNRSGLIWPLGTNVGQFHPSNNTDYTSIESPNWCYVCSFILFPRLYPSIEILFFYIVSQYSFNYLFQLLFTYHLAVIHFYCENERSKNFGIRKLGIIFRETNDACYRSWVSLSIFILSI